MRPRRRGMDERAGRQINLWTHQRTDSPTDKPTDECFRDGRAGPTGASARRRGDGWADPIGVCGAATRQDLGEPLVFRNYAWRTRSDALTPSASRSRIIYYETPTMGNGRTRRSTAPSTDPPADRFTNRQTNRCLFSRWADRSNRGLCAAAARWAGGSNRGLRGGDATRSFA